MENLFLDGERKLKVVKDELTKQVDKCKEDLNTRYHFFLVGENDICENAK